MMTVGLIKRLFYLIARLKRNNVRLKKILIYLSLKCKHQFLWIFLFSIPIKKTLQKLIFFHLYTTNHIINVNHIYSISIFFS